MIKLTDKEKREEILYLVDHYEDYTEYERCTNTDVEEFQEERDNGFIQLLTLGQYNGATDEFTAWELTDNHIVESIETAVYEMNFADVLADVFDDIDKWSSLDLALEFAGIYKVFTLDGNIYADLG